MLFLSQTDETVWKPPSLSKRTPLSTNPTISEQFFHDPLLCPNLKNENPPPTYTDTDADTDTDTDTDTHTHTLPLPLILGGRELCIMI